jgi:hypothetical protein
MPVSSLNNVEFPSPWIFYVSIKNRAFLEDNILIKDVPICVKKVMKSGGEMWTGFIWLSIGTSGGLFLSR